MCLKALGAVNTSDLERRCVNADPNYGILWFHCKRKPLDTARKVRCRLFADSSRGRARVCCLQVVVILRAIFPVSLTKLPLVVCCVFPLCSCVSLFFVFPTNTGAASGEGPAAQGAQPAAVPRPLPRGHASDSAQRGQGQGRRRNRRGRHGTEWRWSRHVHRLRLG